MGLVFLLGSAVFVGIFLEMNSIILTHLLKKSEIPKWVKSPDGSASPLEGIALEKLAFWASCCPGVAGD